MGKKEVNWTHHRFGEVEKKAFPGDEIPGIVVGVGTESDDDGTACERRCCYPSVGGVSVENLRKGKANESATRRADLERERGARGETNRHSEEGRKIEKKVSVWEIEGMEKGRDALQILKEGKRERGKGEGRMSEHERQVSKARERTNHQDKIETSLLGHIYSHLSIVSSGDVGVAESV